MTSTQEYFSLSKVSITELFIKSSPNWWIFGAVILAKILFSVYKFRWIDLSGRMERTDVAVGIHPLFCHEPPNEKCCRRQWDLGRKYLLVTSLFLFWHGVCCSATLRSTVAGSIFHEDACSAIKCFFGVFYCLGWIGSYFIYLTTSVPKGLHFFYYI